MEDNEQPKNTFLKVLAEEKKPKRIRTVAILEDYPDQTVSILIDEVPWRVSLNTLAKLRQK